jgi:hypothetical protein
MDRTENAVYNNNSLVVDARLPIHCLETGLLLRACMLQALLTTAAVYTVTA